jgi:hypothetical protein
MMNKSAKKSLANIKHEIKQYKDDPAFLRKIDDLIKEIKLSIEISKR